MGVNLAVEHKTSRLPGFYKLPPGERVARAMELVEQEKFFSLVAGHQCGKTTCLRWMAAHYNAGDRLRALWIDLQVARDIPDPAVAVPAILDLLQSTVARTLPALHWDSE